MDDFLDTQKVQRGFTLAEMAIVVVLAGILLTMGMKMTVANLNNGAYTQTAGNMALIKTALISYLRTNGTLPCPDTTVAPAAPIGTAAANCNANAAAGSGIVPWKTLGLTIDTAEDGWGNFFTYRVSNGVNPQVRNWTTKTVLNGSFDMGQFTVPLIGLTINQSNGVAAPTLITNTAVAVILSAGKDGYWARTVQGLRAAQPPVTNTDEIINMTAGSTTFIIRPVSDTNPGRGTYSNVVSYLLPQDLLQPLVTEQSVASCRAYCSVMPVTPPCTAANVPMASCTGPGLPAACTVPAATKVPVGYPNPACP